ncbi:MAG: trehalose-phosphatase [Gemmatimonadota bacterium]
MISPLRRSRARLPPPNRLATEDRAYFLDIDGTLLEMAASPGLVRVDRDVRDAIEQLLQSAGGAVALISGRTIADIDHLFPSHRVAVAGQHGAERRDASGVRTTPRAPSRLWEEVRTQLRAVAARHPGLTVEDKGMSLALHYRRATSLASFAHQFMKLLQLELGPDFMTQRGKRVIELKPAGTDKGAAIVAFMSEAPFAGRVPVFLGDDATDEYGFDVVNGLAGVSVKVGAGATIARWRLEDVSAVREWLEREIQVTESAR